MARLPIPGSDDGTWGDVLNEFLAVEHDSDGTLKPSGSLADKEDSGVAAARTRVGTLAARPSAAVSGPAGTGTAGIADARTWAGLIGLENSVVHLYGTSMGGTNAAAWAAANPSLVGGVYMLSPGLSLLHLWDIAGTAIPGGGTYPDYATSMANAYGTTPGDRAAFVTASQDYDPIRNTGDFSGIGSRITIYAARDDDVIGWDNCVDFADQTGATLVASAPEGEPGGGHLTPNLTDAFSEFDALALFDANNP